MKTAPVRSALRCLALALLCAPAPCWAQREGGEVHLKLQDATTVDAILELSRAAKVNVLADTTDLPATSAPISGEWSGELRAWRWRFGRAAGLSTNQPDAHTVLCWVKPDLSALALQAGTEAKERAVQAEESEAAFPGGYGFVLPAPPDGQMHNPNWRPELATELRAHGWGQGEPTEWKPVALAALPPSVRREVVRRIHDDLLSPHQMPLYFWLDDSFWKRARLKISKVGVGDGRRVLMLGGSTVSDANRQGEMMTGVAVLDGRLP